MCWISWEKPEVHIADNEIKVFKIVYNSPNDDNEVISFNMNFKYRFGELHEMKNRIIPGLVLNDSDVKAYGINEGFHSYATLKKAIKIYNELILEPLFSFDIDINDGDGEICLKKKVVKPTIVECIIPKESRYYTNDVDEVVSDKIIISGFLN